jgi:hypothetical protein
MALADHFERHGVELLKQLMDEDPAKCRHFPSKLVSKHELIRLGPSPSDKEPGRIVERAVAGMRWKMPAEGRPAPDRLH